MSVILFVREVNHDKNSPCGEFTYAQRGVAYSSRYVQSLVGFRNWSRPCWQARYRADLVQEEKGVE